MRAADEIARLQQKLESGDLHPDEPLFCLRARDVLTQILVAEWIRVASALGTPAEKLADASKLLDQATPWKPKQIPGVDDSRGKTTEVLVPHGRKVQYPRATGRTTHTLSRTERGVVFDYNPQSSASIVLVPHCRSIPKQLLLYVATRDMEVLK